MTTPPHRHLALSVFVLIATTAVIVTYKLVVLGYEFGEILPRTRYTVGYALGFDGHGGEVEVKTFLPVSDLHQQIADETGEPAGLHFATRTEGLNRRAIWSAGSAGVGSSARYSFTVLGTPIRFVLDPGLAVPTSYPAGLAEDLRAEEDIQADDPAILATLTKIGGDRGTLPQRVQRTFDFVSSLGSRAFKGTTDALTTLRLGEASCNGKSRLLTALLRAAGIPARLVGGLVLETGSKRTSHQWVEAYAGGHWVPLDPTNRHFAELPERYLVLYRGDEALFKHTADINFSYRFDVESELVPSPRAKESFRLLNVWALFDRLGLSFSLLRTLLTLPVGALVVVVFRNVIGMPTFGTFLPALIAAAAGETGAVWGVIGVVTVVGIVALVNRFVARLQLLRSPTLAILLAVVATALIGITLVAERTGLTPLTRISLFPVAVLAITAERFYLTSTEKGAGTAWRELGGTLVVILACYAVMGSIALQVLLVGFPEVILLVIAADAYLGRWSGLRVSEYIRFRHLLRAEAA